MSSSALRFSTELDAYRNKPGTTYMETTGGGRSFWEYSIHQIEMIVSVLGTGAKRIPAVRRKRRGTPGHTV